MELRNRPYEFQKNEQFELGVFDKLERAVKVCKSCDCETELWEAIEFDHITGFRYEKREGMGPIIQVKVDGRWVPL